MNSKIVFTVLLILFLVMGWGCCSDDEPKYEIYENHDVTACGIKDPLVNMEWLREFRNKSIKAYFFEVYLYKQIDLDKYYFVVETHTKRVDGMTPSPIYVTKVYSCNGEQLMIQGTEGPIPDGWDEFFENNQQVALIMSVKEND